MWKTKKSEKGVVSLEASIAVTLFIFLMLFLYSFFPVFEARNEMGHLVLSTANSMALDAYSNEHLGNSGNLSQIIYGLYNLVAGDATDFVSLSEWHEDTTVTTESGETEISALLEDTIRARFIAYLTDGESENAEALLKRYHIVDGKDGLDFSESYIEGDNLYVKVRYKVEYEFHVFGSGTLEIEQSACSKLWK